jgi:hypothetical protein
MEEVKSMILIPMGFCEMNGYVRSYLWKIGMCLAHME